MIPKLTTWRCKSEILSRSAREGVLPIRGNVSSIRIFYIEGAGCCQYKCFTHNTSIAYFDLHQSKIANQDSDSSFITISAAVFPAFAIYGWSEISNLPDDLIIQQTFGSCENANGSRMRLPLTIG